MATGLRVMRGRDWLSGNADGGEGHLGTVVSYWEDETAEVIWDNGKQTVSNIGKDSKYELRVVDTAPVGIRHQNITCCSCEEVNMIGMRWSCEKCSGYDLCSLCYFTGKHDLSHEFKRRDTGQSTGDRVPARDTSKKIRTRGLFPGAVVTRGTHWDQGHKDGGPGKEGTVVVVLSFDSTTHKSAVSVAWESGETTTCRVGHQGQVDVQCVREALGPDIYAEHLPLLDLAGARAALPVTSQAEGGSPQGARVPKLKMGAIVRILDDKDKVKELQDGHGEWIDPMEKALGKVGKVVVLHANGDVNVKFGSQVWIFNPACCVPITKCEQLYESSDVEDSEPLDLLKILGKTLEQQIQLLGRLGSDEEGGRMSLKGEGSTEFLEAIKDSDVERVKKVLERFPKLVTVRPDNGITCLHIAAKYGKLEIVKFLVEKWFDVNAKDLSGNTALLKALTKKHVDVSRFLIETGTDLEISNDKGQSALHCAVYAANASLVRDLMIRGCDVNVVDNSGDTPLHDAIGQNENTCAEMILMSPNLDLTIANERGFNPLQWAAFHGKFGGTLVEKTILRNKSLIDVKLEDGSTPLHIAAINDHKEATEILIKQGADVNIKDKNEATPLHLACDRGFVGATKILVNAGADVNMVDVNKNTPLHVLMGTSESSEGDPKLLKHGSGTQRRIKLAIFLLEHGADVNARNKDDKTPVDICTVKTLKKAVEHFKTESSKPASTLVSALLCSQCFSRTADVTLLPCNHKFTCRECHKMVSVCPICGGEVAKAFDADSNEIHEA
ncbi:E3 ubiquitin-protein ligase MIB2-like isoform X2 [Gigantopelta aegis]|uniref:E3 ubiquitin-protein ligase MIB2-like isoform X2 n=1 Tax=Gigantopelta aegis TaxID=1735272 RepID=UPI001B888073|nr:E3 ubiquitin-protein ligase MIB2-like isoform X2 [Gigantopelta aegis]